MEVIVMWAFAVFVGGGIIFIVFAPYFPWLKNRSTMHIFDNFEVWEDIRGLAHRTDGPVMIDGLKIVPALWFWHGKEMSFNDWCKVARVSKKKKALLLLKYKP